jgi:hypothetical protein
MKEDQTMNDSEVNPMRTGLMFIPLGLVMSPGCPTPSRRRDHLADLEAAADHGPHAPTIALEAPRRSAFRRLLERLRQIPQRHLPSPT